LTVLYTAIAASRVYGSANPTLTGTTNATGLVNGDTLSGVTSGTAAFTTAATATTNVGNLAVNGSGLSGASANYNFSFVQAAGNARALTITPAPLSVLANDSSRLFGATNPTLTYASSGLLNGDTLSGALATNATEVSHAGDYQITQGTLSASSNYTLKFTGATFKVIPLLAAGDGGISGLMSRIADPILVQAVPFRLSTQRFNPSLSIFGHLSSRLGPSLDLRLGMTSPVSEAGNADLWVDAAQEEPK
jgi:MBG domain (YGX type)